MARETYMEDVYVGGWPCGSGYIHAPNSTQGCKGTVSSSRAARREGPGRDEGIRNITQVSGAADGGKEAGIAWPLSHIVADHQPSGIPSSQSRHLLVDRAAEMRTAGVRARARARYLCGTSSAVDSGAKTLSSLHSHARRRFVSLLAPAPLLASPISLPICHAVGPAKRTLSLPVPQPTGRGEGNGT